MMPRCDGLWPWQKSKEEYLQGFDPRFFYQVPSNLQNFSLPLPSLSRLVAPHSNTAPPSALMPTSTFSCSARHTGRTRLTLHRPDAITLTAPT